MTNLELVRYELEKEYTHVTFFKTDDEYSYWSVGEEGVKIKLPLNIELENVSYKARTSNIEIKIIKCEDGKERRFIIKLKSIYYYEWKDGYGVGRTWELNKKPKWLKEEDYKEMKSKQPKTK